MNVSGVNLIILAAKLHFIMFDKLDSIELGI